MADAGLISLAVLIFSPIVWVKLAKWRNQRKHAGQQEHPSGATVERLARFPTPLTLPSNVMVVLTFVALCAYHASALLLPSRRALQSDIFLLLDKGVNTPTTVMRSLLDTFPRATMGWKATWSEEGLNTFLRRLGSFEGRRLHLLIGIDPFISCTFCDSAKEYIYFSLATRIAQYGADMFLFGILTLRFDALNTLDDVAILCVQLTSGYDLSLTEKTTDSGNRFRAHRHHWRTIAKYYFALFALSEAAVLTGMYEFGLAQGRWSHWYANRNLAWHGGLLLMAVAIFLSPRTPHVPTLVQIVQSLNRAEAMHHELRANLQAAHLTQQIVFQDHRMRERAMQFFDRYADSAKDEDTDDVVDRLTRHAQAERIDVAQLRSQSRITAHSVWASSETIWEAHDAKGTTRSASSSTLLS